MQIDQIVQDRSAEVILDTQPLEKIKQAPLASRWLFTLNNWTEDQLDQIIRVFELGGFKYIIGKEVAPTTGTPHLQGYCEKKQRFRPTQLKLFKAIHWERARGTKQENIAYCSKECHYMTNFIIDAPIKIIESSAFFKWQKWIFTLLMNEPDDRTVYWLWEETGGVGKSQFAKYMAVKHNALIVDGKSADIFNGILNFKESMGFYPKIVIIDCPRHNIDYMNYGAIEKVKNGLVFNGKYESKQLIFNSPHVLVFANERPDTSQYSADRWIIQKIKKD